MKIAVIYKSKYGSTKKYAELIANELNCSIFEHSQIKPQELSQYDLVIYGGGLYAGMVSGLGLVKECKNLIVFTVGLLNPKTADYTETLKTLPQGCRAFHLRGSLDYSKMTFFHKTGLKVLRSMLKKKKELSEDDKTIIEIFEKPVDFIDNESIKPVLEYVKVLG